MDTTNSVFNQTFTVDQIRNYLLEHPDFFKANADIFCRINVPRQRRDGTPTLVECQYEILRETLSSYETRMEELQQQLQQPLLNQNSSILLDRFAEWASALVATHNLVHMPETIVEGSKRLFNVPYGTLRLWNLSPTYINLPCAEPVDEEIQTSIDAMEHPYCGINQGTQIGLWLGIDAELAQSVIILPLRHLQRQTFGFVVLASNDPTRFRANMGTIFLSRMAELASAALVKLTR